MPTAAVGVRPTEAVMTSARPVAAARPLNLEARRARHEDHHARSSR